MAKTTVHEHEREVPKKKRKKRSLFVATEEELKAVETAAAWGAGEAQICLNLRDGISQDSFQRNEPLMAAWRKGKARGVMKIGQTLYNKAAAGDVTCMIFYLKTQGRWSELNRVEVSGPDGQPIQSGVMVVPTPPSAEEWEKMVAKISEARNTLKTAIEDKSKVVSEQ